MQLIQAGSLFIWHSRIIHTTACRFVCYDICVRIYTFQLATLTIKIRSSEPGIRATWVNYSTQGNSHAWGQHDFGTRKGCVEKGGNSSTHLLPAYRHSEGEKASAQPKQNPGGEGNTRDFPFSFVPNPCTPFPPHTSAASFPDELWARGRLVISHWLHAIVLVQLAIPSGVLQAPHPWKQQLTPARWVWAAWLVTQNQSNSSRLLFRTLITPDGACCLASEHLLPATFEAY